MATKKQYTFKNYSGTKTLIVLDMNADILALYKEAKKLCIPFAVKKDNGIQVWGSQTVADYLGISDVSLLINGKI